MNIIEGLIQGTAFQFADGTSVDLGTLPPGVTDGPVALGLRPEHLRLNPTGTMAEVIVIEPTGSETQVVLRVGGHDLVGVFRERINAQPGQSIGIAFDNTLMHLFDSKTGKRIRR